MPILEPIAYDIRRSGRSGAGMDSAGSGLELRENPRTPSPGAEVGGEVDEALSMFWYRNLLRAGTDSPEVDPDWGIHVNADALVEWAAGIATAMERDGVANASTLSLDLAFIFGFDHCFFHHCVDAQISLHMMRLHASGQPMPDLRSDQHKRCEKLHDVRHQPQWWFAIEESLANAHVARDPTRLGGLREAFLRYGILPQPLDGSRGPWALWEQLAMDSDAFSAASYMLWLQHLTGEIDPLGILSEIEMDVEEGGIDAALNRMIDRILEASQPQPDGEDGGNEHDWIADQSLIPRLHAFGGFTEGLFRRLDVPIWFHGGNGPDLIRRYDPQRGEWPYGTIERLYSHFRSSEVNEEWDDPFSGDDDDFELSP
ncbi:MAG: hypothetical protein CMB26_00365 [Euryarchaeota archaeon]|nr:hypothetical protein [Euryarchaeota archaeon]|tara:strand:+ start:2144 stop:3256 length:1113 start_codon:yes stop_codon:yes gene_type:complete